MNKHQERSNHPLGLTGKVLAAAAITTVGMALTSGVASADPAPGNTNAASTSDSKPAPATDVRTMTDRELGQQLQQVAGKDSLREQEIVTEMKARGTQFWESAPATSGIGISATIPIRPGVNLSGTLAYDPVNGHWITSGGIRLGKPSAPQFTGISPKPDGINVDANGKISAGEYADLNNKLSMNIAPDGIVTGSYKAKVTVKTPDGRSYDAEVTVERQADGSWKTKLPDGITTSTPLPGGGSIDTKRPTDPTKDADQPAIKGPAPEPDSGASPEAKKFWGGDVNAGASVDKEIMPKPAPEPTPEELEKAKQDYANQQAAQHQRTEEWKAQSRPEAERREGQERANDRAAAADAAQRAAMPDRDHDGIPDAQDATPNQNDTDITSTDRGDGPEGGQGYPSGEVTNPPLSSPPASSDPNADFDHDGIPDRQDPTWNQNDTDPTSTDVGDGPEGNAGYGPATTAPDASAPATAPDASATTPDTSAPAATTPDTSAPAATAPDTSNRPSATTPDTSNVPAATTPDTSNAPAATAPDTSNTPAVTAPDTSNAPAVTAPDTSAPAATTPDTSTRPSATTPDTNAPAATAPDTSAPAATTPETSNTPAVTAPDTSAPAITAPDVSSAAPSISTPSNSLDLSTPDLSGSTSAQDLDGDGLTGASDATPTQNNFSTNPVDVGNTSITGSSSVDSGSLSDGGMSDMGLDSGLDSGVSSGDLGTSGLGDSGLGDTGLDSGGMSDGGAGGDGGGACC